MVHFDFAKYSAPPSRRRTVYFSILFFSPIILIVFVLTKIFGSVLFIKNVCANFAPKADRCELFVIFRAWFNNLTLRTFFKFNSVSHSDIIANIKAM